MLMTAERLVPMPKRKRRGVQKQAADRVGPTPETAAKLEPDPLFDILAMHGRGDASLEHAAGEIREVYGAICKGLFRKDMKLGERLAASRGEMPDRIAEAHAERYLPWANDQHPRLVDAVIRVVWDRDDVPFIWYEPVALALADYARRMPSGLTRRRL